MQAIKSLGRAYLYAMRSVRRHIQAWRIPKRPPDRKWMSALSFGSVVSIQRGAARYSYRGIRMMKNPFDLALYQLLFWDIKPQTVIEVGSKMGGSALWFGDLMQTYGIDGRVISVDLNPPDPPIRRSNVGYLKGNALHFEKTLTPDVLANVRHPVLFVEDSAHFPETSLAAMEFFDRVSKPGDFMVIEDGDVIDAAIAHKYRGGPGVAIAEFLSKNGDRYRVDATYCDFYGYNFTASPNGYLRRIA
ncbi:MAG: hypothetical protein OJF62_000286 [Pseudolabrys sp.]|nr:hypothetical protein [Pseudolabrys sp.]